MSDEPRRDDPVTPPPTSRSGIRWLRTPAQIEVGADDLDLEVMRGREVQRLPLARFASRTRAALGLGPLVAPALLFVPIGALIGPRGAGWVTLDALAHLYPVLAVGLATLGLFVGMGLRLDHRYERRLLAFASLEAIVTILVVTAAFWYLLVQWGLPLAGQEGMLAIVLGICASATAAGVATPNAPPTYAAAMRMADLDDVLPVILGGLVLAYATATAGDAPRVFALNVAVPVAIAAAGWLLLEYADEPAERAVFLLGVIGLLGGAAMYLGASPLLAGMVAGALWRHAPGQGDVVIREDLKRLQHPLIVTLLICAGALAPFAALGSLLAVVYVLTRFTGKLFGGWIVARALHDVSPIEFGSHLLSPGVIGLGFALSFHLVASSTISGAALTAVAVGTLASEILAAFAILEPRRA